MDWVKVACHHIVFKNNNEVLVYDDFKINNKLDEIKKNKLIQKIKNYDFDLIIISPGIDINNCKLSKF